ncbi:MFS transporter [Undibacterium sp. CCC3.4]|uniref:MFS transporter n=3 Tax=Undibacterium TaxID=401469 RepID=UPI003A1013C2
MASSRLMPLSAKVTPPAIYTDGLPARERLLAMLALSLGVAMASLDTAIANTALPAIAAQLHTSAAASVWIINVYQLAMVATLLPFAALGEIIGYRRVALAGIALFTLASLACACAWSLPSLVIARLFQGLGGSAIMGVNTALLRSIFPAQLQGRGFGLNSMVVAVAFATGPTLASLILVSAAWPWLFAINIIPGVIALLLGRRFLPLSAGAKHQIDKLTVFYNIVAFSLLILLFGDAAHLAARTTLLTELIATMAFFGLLIHRQRNHHAPMLPLDLLRRPLFLLSVVTAIFTFATQSLAFVTLPFYFEIVLGRSPVETGFLITPWAIMVAIMAPLAGRLSDRYPAGLLGGIGLAILAAGMSALVFMPTTAGVADIVWRMAVCGVGFGFFQAPNLKAIMNSAPAKRAGSASGIVATARLLGQASGAALVALCLSLSGNAGTSHALVLGALFAGCASIASFSRLFVAATPE